MRRFLCLLLAILLTPSAGRAGISSSTALSLEAARGDAARVFDGAAQPDAPSPFPSLFAAVDEDSEEDEAGASESGCAFGSLALGIIAALAGFLAGGPLGAIVGFAAGLLLGAGGCQGPR